MIMISKTTNLAYSLRKCRLLAKSCSTRLISDQVRVRFAPSPTGNLHLGGFRTALFNFLFARKANGKMILRIEDTDRTRYVSGAEESIERLLRWAGVEVDESPSVGGDYGPYRQSERKSLYEKHANDMLAEGKAYHCFCSSERLAMVRDRALKAGLPPTYDRYCRSLSPSQVAENLKQQKPFTIRLKVPLSQSKSKLSFKDLVHGQVEFAYHTVDDQILLKSCGMPTYHLANVVDDHYMKISHVIRGEEWLTSTPKHIILYQAFGWKTPEFAHLPLILNPDKTKLSKRQKNSGSMDAIVNAGYLPEAVFNFAALIGWWPANIQESGNEPLMDMQTIISNFSLQQVSRVNTSLHMDRLDKLNRKHSIHLWESKKGRERLLKLLRSSADYSGFSDDYLIKCYDIMKDNLYKIQSMKDEALFLFQRPNIDRDAVMSQLKLSEQQMNAVSSGYRQVEKCLLNSTGAAWPNNMMQILSTGNTGVKPSVLKKILRLALTGQPKGPRLDEILAILGPEDALERMKFLR